MHRILEIATGPATLHLKTGNVVIERDGQPPAAVPLIDVGAIILTEPRVVLTPGFLYGAAEAGCSVVILDDCFLPVAVLQPTNANAVQTERMLKQASAKLPLKKRLWQQIIRSKIRNQARTLVHLREADNGLALMANRVRSGDPDNVEAQAARRYWPLLMLDDGFRRDPAQDGVNRWLNYGYAVCRATIARAICAAGLHPSLGLHHHNKYNPFCLADDLMEPYRPRVDRVVMETHAVFAKAPVLERESKATLVEGLTAAPIPIDSQERSLSDSAAITATSLAQVFAGDRQSLVLPDA